MASSLLILLDDIATVLDDISVLTKVAAKKTAGVLGDDLALNAQQVTGVRPARELPVVWAVAKGSLLNKMILVPAALAISAFAPWAITPLLILGGAYLCYEGVEKVVHKFAHRRHAKKPGKHTTPSEDAEAAREAALDLEARLAEEKIKIRGAIRTDFILSAEIIVITLGIIADEPFAQRIGVLVTVALLMTIGVYGLVAGIVKIDDLGMMLAQRSGAIAKKTGRAILAAAPWLMRTISVVGTAAMFLVGGGILVHGVEPLHHLSDHLRHGLTGPVRTIAGMLFDGVIGVALGAAVLAVVALVKRVVARRDQSR
jgi:predicted DNA repair protein MutK